VVEKENTKLEIAAQPELFREKYTTLIETLNTAPTTVYFTDGSRDTANFPEPRVGFGVVTPNNTQNESYSLPSWASVFQAEVCAIQEAINTARDTGDRHALIVTDSLSAIKALQNPHPRDNHKVIKDTLDDIELGYELGTKVTIVWVPSHIGIEGNEQADELARAALSDPDPLPLKPTRKQLLAAAWGKLRSYTLAQPKRLFWYDKTMEGKPVTVPSGTPRIIERAYYALRLGQRDLHMYKNDPETNKCSVCDEEHFTSKVIHFLTECPGSLSLRYELLQGSTVQHSNAEKEAEQALTIMFSTPSGAKRTAKWFSNYLNQSSNMKKS
jgi:ribonuclease HI